MKLFKKNKIKHINPPLEEAIKLIESSEGRAHFLNKIEDISNLDKKYIDEAVNTLTKKSDYETFNMQANILVSYGLVDEAKKKIDSYMEFKKKQLKIEGFSHHESWNCVSSSPFYESGLELYYYESLPNPDYVRAAKLAKDMGKPKKAQDYFHKALKEKLRNLEENKKKQESFPWNFSKEESLAHNLQDIADFAIKFDKKVALDYYILGLQHEMNGRSRKHNCLKKLSELGEKEETFTDAIIDAFVVTKNIYEAINLAKGKRKHKYQQLVQNELSKIESESDWYKGICFAAEHKLNNKISYYLGNFLESLSDEENFNAHQQCIEKYGTDEQKKFYQKKHVKQFEKQELPKLERKNFFGQIAYHYNNLNEIKKAIPYYEKAGHFSKLAKLASQNKLPELQKYRVIYNTIEKNKSSNI